MVECIFHTGEMYTNNKNRKLNNKFTCLKFEANNKYVTTEQRILIRINTFSLVIQFSKIENKSRLSPSFVFI